MIFLKQTYDKGFGQDITCISWSPDDTLLAVTIHQDIFIGAWNPKEEEKTKRFQPKQFHNVGYNEQSNVD